MNQMDPNVIIDNKRQIASHYYPLTGPYDSGDPFILNYQTLLMRIAGIDGVIIDWYGKERFRDYQNINSDSLKLPETIKENGLVFAVMYEDQTVRHMIENGHINQSEAVAQGKKEITYLDENFFSSESYLTVNGRPVLFVFGPQYFYNVSDWEEIFSNLVEPPIFITLDKSLPQFASGSFPWPPMWASSGGVLYEKKSSWSICQRDYLEKEAVPYSELSL